VQNNPENDRYHFFKNRYRYFQKFFYRFGQLPIFNWPLKPIFPNLLTDILTKYFKKTKKTGRNIHELQGHILLTHMCTGRKATASEHRIRNLAIRSLIRYHYTNFACYFNKVFWLKLGGLLTAPTYGSLFYKQKVQNKT